MCWSMSIRTVSCGMSDEAKLERVGLVVEELSTATRYQFVKVENPQVFTGAGIWSQSE